MTSLRFTVLGRPPSFGGGSSGSSNFHCLSVKSVGYDFRFILFTHPLSEKNTKHKRVLAKRSDETDINRIWMVEAKILVSVSFTWLYSFGRKFDYYYRWIVGLMNYLEAEFDINRYREYQLLRLVELMDDKIGRIRSDELERIPHEESLAGQLQAINQKLELMLNLLPDKS